MKTLGRFCVVAAIALASGALTGCQKEEPPLPGPAASETPVVVKPVPPPEAMPAAATNIPGTEKPKDHPAH